MLDYIFTYLSRDTQINMLKHALPSHDFALEEIFQKPLLIDNLSLLDPYLEQELLANKKALTVKDYIPLSLSQSETLRQKVWEGVHQFSSFSDIEEQAKSIATDLHKKAKFLRKKSFFELYCSYTSFSEGEIEEEILNYLQNQKSVVLEILRKIEFKTLLSLKEGNRNLAFQKYFTFKNKQFKITNLKKLLDTLGEILSFDCTFGVIAKNEFFVFFKNKNEKDFVVGTQLSLSQNKDLCEVKVKDGVGIAKINLKIENENSLNFFEFEKLIYNFLIVLNKNSQKNPTHGEFLNLPQYHLLYSLLDEKFLNHLGWSDGLEISQQYQDFQKVKNYTDAVFVLGLINFWKNKKISASNGSNTLRNNIEMILQTYSPHPWLFFQLHDYQVERYWELHYIISKIQADKLYFKYPDFKSRLDYYHVVLKKYYGTIPMNLYIKKFID